MREIKVTVKLHLAILPGEGTVTRACGLASLGLILSCKMGLNYTDKRHNACKNVGM